MKIAIDFDGSCVTHRYPDVGDDIGAVPVLRALVNQGHQLILFTMRSDEKLQDAVNWFQKNGIYLHGVNKDPGQTSWTNSNKCYAELYIDDMALGAPLINHRGERPYLDWVKIAEYCYEKGILINGSVDHGS